MRTTLCLLPLLLLPVLTLTLTGSEDGQPDPTTSSHMERDLARFRQLQALIRLVRNEYVETVGEERLWQGALRGIVAELDRESRWLSAAEMVLANPSASGRALGFGYDWDLHPNGMVIVSRVVDHGPAARGGLYAGDVILGLAGNDLAALSQRQIQRLFMTVPDQVALMVRHPDGETAQLTLERGEFVDSGVSRARMLPGDDAIGIIRLSRFHAGEPSRKQA